MRTKIEIVSVNVGRPAPLAYQNKIVPSGIGKNAGVRTSATLSTQS